MRIPKVTGERPPNAAPSPRETSSLTGDEALDDLVRDHPGLRVPLMSYGLCTCCNGSLTLRENADARGLSLDTTLNDLRHELSKAM